MINMDKHGSSSANFAAKFGLSLSLPAALYNQAEAFQAGSVCIEALSLVLLCKACTENASDIFAAPT